MSKTCKQLDIEKLGVCTVKLRPKDQSVKCRFLVVPGECQAVPGMPDIKLLIILRITLKHGCFLFCLLLCI